MAKRTPSRLARRRTALSWVISHLPNPDHFTTHDVSLMAEILMPQTWPPYLKIAWRTISTRQDTIGHAIGRHPDFEKHPDGIVSRQHRGTRIRSQTWQRR